MRFLRAFRSLTKSQAMSKSNDLPMAYRPSVAKPLPVKYQKTEHFRFNIEATHLLGVENLEPVQ